MKVICIDARLCEFLVEGNIYTVWKEIKFMNDPAYIIVEAMPQWGENAIFRKERFIPVSDIDETEMIREYKTELV